MVVRSDLDTQHSTATTQSSAVVHNRRNAHERARPKFYVVRSGDSLSAIAVKTGVSQAALQALNPTLSPNSLQTGQRLRLRR
jgi:LysM repeat protein